MRRGVRDATWKSHIVHSLDEIFAKGEDLEAAGPSHIVHSLLKIKFCKPLDKVTLFMLWLKL